MKPETVETKPIEVEVTEENIYEIAPKFSKQQKEEDKNGKT